MSLILLPCVSLLSIIAYVLHVLLLLRRVRQSFLLVDKAVNLADRGPRPTIDKKSSRLKFSPELVGDAPWDAIVIGSGIGGLSTAAMLGRAGWRVLVLEQHGRVGGCCHTFTKGVGFEFDSGIHFVGRMHEGSSNAKLLAKLTNNQLRWASQGDNYDVVTIGEGAEARQYKFTVGLPNLRAMLLQNFEDIDDQKSVNKFCDLLAAHKDMESGQMLVKFLPLPIVRLMYRLGVFRSAFFTIGQQSTLDVIQGLTTNEELRSLLLYMIPAIGFDMDSSWCITAAVWMHYVDKGCFYPIGGSNSIVHPLLSTVRANDGQVLVKARVGHILCSAEGIAHGVRVSHGKGQSDVHARVIISAVGVPHTFNQLLPREIATKSRYFEYISEHGASINMVFVGLRGSAAELGVDRRNHHFIPDRRLRQQLETYNELCDDDLLDAVPPFYSVTFPSAKDPEYQGKHPDKTVCIMATPTSYAKHWGKWGESKHKRRPEDYEVFKRSYMHALWGMTLRHFPQLEGKLEFITMGTPLSIEHYLNAAGGSIASLPHNQTRFHPLNCANLRVETDVPGLYLTGQDITSGGFSGALAGGLLTTAHLLNRFGGRNGVRL